MSTKTKKRTPDPLKIDPSLTGPIRRAFVAEIRRRMNRVRSLVVSLLDDGTDAFYSVPDRIEWLTARIRRLIETEMYGSKWWEVYAHRAYMLGARRTWGDFREVVTPSTPRNHPQHRLRRDEFLGRVTARKLVTNAPPMGMFGGEPSSVSRRPVSSPQVRDAGGRFMSERVGSLSARMETELKGMTTDMIQKIAREVLDGIDRRWTPRTIASAVRRRVDISRARAETIARTEIVRAQAEAQLDAMDELGVTSLEAMVEWEVRGANVCPLCSPLDGIVFTVEEARGMIPRHPNCRCAWMPRSDDTYATKRSAERAVAKSKRLESGKGSDWGPAEEIGPRRLTNNEPLDIDAARLAATFEQQRKGVGQ